MASHRIGEMGLSETGPSAHHLPYSLFHGINHPATFINQEGSSGFDFGELEEAIVLQGVNIRNNEAKEEAPLYAAKPAATLEMFPSWPIRFQQTPREITKSGGGEESSGDSGSASAVNNNTLASISEGDQALREAESPSSQKAVLHDQTQALAQMHLQHPQHQHQQQQQPMDIMAGGPNQSVSKTPQEKRKGGSTSEKHLDAKTLRRLAQNREAARKSRLRKKAYVQQLESSRIKLTQLEQDLQRARSQGLFLGACGASGNISSGAAIFDMEYARWLEDDHRHMSELRTGVQVHLPEGDLRVIVDSYVSHYDEIFRLKGLAAKSDVFHLITGMWATPAERCFLWMGGFRPSELIKILREQLDPLTEQQLMGMYSLQHSSQQAEEALTQGLEQLQQSLVDTISGGPVIDGVQQMAVALGKLTNLEGFIRQADNLRQQTLHQLRRTLTVRQAARCFLVIGEYYGRLRALSSLWASRPREHLMNDDSSCQTTADLQIVQSTQNHFSNF